MKTAPCITCPDKGCGSRHDTCEKYKEWDGKRKEILKKQKEEIESNSFQIERIRRFKGKKWDEKTNRK